jgi:hypothetical protein
MSFLDFLIIYLSLGAPFGAYVLVRNEETLEFRGILSAVAAILVWPLYAVRSAIRHSGASHGNTAFDTDTEPDAKLLEQIDSLSQQFSDATKPSHRLIAKQVEQNVERYVELSLAAMTKTATRNGQYFELLTVSGHPSPSSGTGCLNRRNRNIIERHLSNARKELIMSLADLSPDRYDAEKVLRKIADLLDDKQLASMIPCTEVEPNDVQVDKWATPNPAQERFSV